MKFNKLGNSNKDSKNLLKSCGYFIYFLLLFLCISSFYCSADKNCLTHSLRLLCDMFTYFSFAMHPLMQRFLNLFSNILQLCLLSNWHNLRYIILPEWRDFHNTFNCIPISCLMPCLAVDLIAEYYKICVLT